MEIAQVIQPDYPASQNFIWMLKEAALGRRLTVHSMNACPRPGVSQAAASEEVPINVETHEGQGKTFPLRIFREGEGGLSLYSRTGTWESHALCPCLGDPQSCPTSRRDMSKSRVEAGRAQGEGGGSVQT